ncbi:SDR family oxidoreductase [Sphingomicrobium lutaoense]|uniref:NAD(P)-dependent dehydrogenase (Short-subunit alcohol dehydrogenase family) n=1 Tax=Sphingomicrobium lutaoense TaxID=515949 RepID=A0A839YWF9_9SPHN|nr:SDR family oxidoreductase [Sphingomicrobium lutaoense]MBB3763366.1 NAD(P)-dependent dehydrogenase (short-subunit alcohol dehydrogenase family) [Sphingomicrobium lutaoense]
MSTDAKPLALVTGARCRVGRRLSERLIAEGWDVIAHVRRPDDEVAEGARAVAGDLADPAIGEKLLDAAGAPLDLLVNNAARFAPDSLDAFSTDEFAAHMAVNLQAPALLTQAMAKRHPEGHRAAIINILDAKLASPNPDFLSYTLSKSGLAALADIAARALAPKGIRVNGIAPALMLQSAGQGPDDFKRVHALNPLGHGVEPDELVDAVLYLARAPGVTGQTLILDAGQRFMALPRDVQYLEKE